MKKLKDAIQYVSYAAALQVTERDAYGHHRYIFPECQLITRETIEKFYPELLERELCDGFHGEGFRDGLYISLKGAGDNGKH